MPQPHRGRIDQHGKAWRVQIKVGGKRIRRSFRSRSEAEAELARIVGEISRDVAKELAENLGLITVAALVELYLERRGDDLELSTQARYRNVVDKYVVPGIGAVPAKDVCATPMLLEDWLATVPWGSARKALEVLGPAFRLAHDNGLILSNPVTKIRRPKRPDRRHKKDIPTPIEVEKMIVAAYEEDVWWGYFVELTTTLGTRRSETAALRWEDFEFPRDAAKHGRIHIRRAIGKKSGGIYIKRPKSGQERDLLVHRSLFEGLDAFDGASGWLFPGRDVRPRKDPEALTSSSTSGRLLLWLVTQGGELQSHSGRAGAAARRTFRISLTARGADLAARLSAEDDPLLPVHPDTVGHHFEEMVERLELRTASGEPYTLHSLRHFRATHLYNKSKDWVQVARYLGHTSPAITMELYANNVVQPTQALLADAAVSLNTD